MNCSPMRTAFAVVFALSCGRAAAVPVIDLASRGAFPAQMPSDGASNSGGASSDGRFRVFASDATTFGVPDANRVSDIYLHDRDAGTFALLSRVGTTQGDGDSVAPAISADGARVVFVSKATNLVAGDTNAFADVFVLERASGTLRRLTPAPGVQPDAASSAPQISADGRWVAFLTTATNWFAGDPIGTTDLVVYDLSTDTAEHASVGNGGAPAAALFANATFSLSAGGRCVSFDTGTPLVAADTNGSFFDVYLRNLDTDTTVLVSVSGAGTAGNGFSQESWVAPDCSRVVFGSGAQNLHPDGVVNYDSAAFEKDLGSGAVARVWPDAAEAYAGQNVSGFQGSANGAHFAFGAINIVDPNSAFLPEGRILSVRRSDGAQTLSPAAITGTPLAVQDDGAAVLFVSQRPLVTSDRNALNDIAVFDTAGLARIPLTVPASPVVASSANGASGIGAKGSPLFDGQFRQQFASDDGLLVGFSSIASNLIPNDDNNFEDVFVRDRRTGVNQRITRGLAGAEANGDSILTDMSADGRWLVIESCATNLVAGDTGSICDVFVTDRTATPLVFDRVNLADDESAANGGAFDGFGGHWGSISADGRYVAFASIATNLVPGDTNNRPDLFLRDRVAGTTTLLTRGPGGVPSTSGVIAQPKISADGRFVSFRAGNSNLLPNPTPAQILVVDTTTLAYERVSVTSDEVSVNAGASRSFISSDGRYVAFVGLDGTVPGDADGQPDVFVRDRLLGKTTIASLRPDGTDFEQLTFVGGLSSRGLILPFIVDEGGGATGAAYAYDISTGRVEQFLATQPGVSQILRPAASSNGRFVAFADSAVRLPTDQNGKAYDIYLASGFVSGISGGAEGAAPELALSGSAAANAEMGDAVAISEKFIVSGAPGINEVYVYERPAGATGTTMMGGVARTKSAKAFNLVATLSPPGGGGLGDKWGSAVAISPDGNVIAIGVPGVGTGQVAVFERPATGWTSTNAADQQLNAPPPGPDVVFDKFGTAVDIGQDGRLVVGAPMTDVFGAQDAGMIAVYAPQAGSLDYVAQGQPMSAPVAQAGAGFGMDVAITPNAIAVGAPLENDGANVDEGAVYTYASDGGDPYSVSATIRPPGGGQPGDKWGTGVGLGPNTLVVGSPGDDTAGTDTGAGYVYASPTNIFGTTTPSALMAERTIGGEAVGTSVEVAGDYVVIGAPLADRLSVLDTGSAFVFERPELGWQTRAQHLADIELRASESQGGQEFGDAVAVTAQGLVIGVPQRDVGVREDQGEADTFVFDRIIRTGFE